jgi:hypothetical protein
MVYQQEDCEALSPTYIPELDEDGKSTRPDDSDDRAPKRRAPKRRAPDSLRIEAACRSIASAFVSYKETYSVQYNNSTTSVIYHILDVLHCF